MPLKDNELAYRVSKMKHNFWKHFDKVHIFFGVGKSQQVGMHPEFLRAMLVHIYTVYLSGTEWPHYGWGPARKSF